MDVPAKTRDKITQLYGQAVANKISGDLAKLLDKYAGSAGGNVAGTLTERDVMLITYADTLHQTGKVPFNTLNLFAEQRLKGLVSIIHILPCFPYSSDDGFSITDYRAIKAELGDWHHVGQLAENFNLSLDLVINHCSSHSRYFKAFLRDDPSCADFFITVDPEADTSAVLRPRTSPLLHQYDSASGPRWCWTTFSEDQVDLNFKNPAVLLEMLDVLLFYVSYGAGVIRLDAIAYLWKEAGSSCAHLAQTHLVVQLIRDVLDIVAPKVKLLTETNVPHEENISYFGDGSNEAQLVYNFPLPPLILYTLTTGNAKYLTEWARTLEPVSETTTFLNFTASHDGIGMRPAADILDANEFQILVDLAKNHGGEVSCKHDQDGNDVPYELNINYFDAINNPNALHEDLETAIDRFMLSQAIPMSLLGVPAVYIHSLLGSRNWSDKGGAKASARAINREKLDFDVVEQQLHDSFSRRARVFNRYRHLITVRQEQRAFHPQAGQQILDFGSQFFALLRTAPDESQAILALHNVTPHSQVLEVSANLLGAGSGETLTNVLNGQTFTPGDPRTYTFKLSPYQFIWLKIG